MCESVNENCEIVRRWPHGEENERRGAVRHELTQSSFQNTPKNVADSEEKKKNRKTYQEKRAREREDPCRGTALNRYSLTG